MTVLLTAVAASIVLVILTQTLNSSKGEQERSSADAAGRRAEEVLLDVERALSKDPSYFLHNVSQYERDRLCIVQDSRVIKSGTAWPAGCGGAWTYAKGSTPAAEGAVLEVVPPNPDNSLLQLRVLATAGTSSSGLVATYRLDGAGRYSAWSSVDLALDDLSSGTGVTDLSGTLYSGGTVFLPSSDQVKIQNAQILTEEDAFAGPLSGGTVRYYAAQTSNGEVPVRDVRSVAPTRMSTSSLASSATSLSEIACSAAPKVINGGYGAQLCLQAGANVVRSDGSTATIPGDVKGYLLLAGESGTAGTVNVYYSTKNPSYSGNCLIRCDLTALAAPEVAAGTHPGSRGYWSSFLGTFPLPVTGVVSTDRDVHVGLCGDAFLTRGAACQSVSGTQPGMAVERSFTVLAGTPDRPSSIFVSGPLNSVGNARLGLVSTGEILLPYWARSAGSNLDVDAALVSLGLGGAEDPVAESSIRTLPRFTSPPTTDDPNYGLQLVLTGSVVAPRVDLDMGIFLGVSLVNDTVLLRTPPPYLPGFTGSWEQAVSRQMSVEEIAAIS